MDAPILHEAGPTDICLQDVPISVRVLDAVCNARIASAPTEDALDAELRRKQYFKRVLVDLPSADLEIYALARLNPRARERAGMTIFDTDDVGEVA